MWPRQEAESGKQPGQRVLPRHDPGDPFPSIRKVPISSADSTTVSGPGF